MADLGDVERVRIDVEILLQSINRLLPLYSQKSSARTKREMLQELERIKFYALRMKKRLDNID